MDTQRLLTFWIILVLVANRSAPAVGHIAYGLMLLTAGWMWWKEYNQLKMGFSVPTPIGKMGKIYGGLFLLYLCTILPSVLAGDIQIGLRTVIYVFGYRFLIFLIILKFVRRKELLYAILAVFFLVIAVDSIMAYYQYAMTRFKLRGLGFAGPVLSLAGLICIAVPSALIVCFDYAFPKWLRLVSGFSLIPMAFGLLGNQSRAVWVLAFFSGVIVGIRYLRKTWKLVVPVLCLFMGLVYYIYQDPMLLKRLVSITDSTKDLSNLGRIYVWKSSMNMIVDHFWFGVGPDQFAGIYQKSYILPQEVQKLGHAHNNFLQVFVESGVIGFVGFCIWIFGSIGYGVRTLLKESYSPYVFAVVLAFLFYHICFGLIEYTLVINARMTYFWVLIAVMLQLETIKENKY